jgi:uncharacterized membrane protein YoaK (UPF0700 family)
LRSTSPERTRDLLVVLLALAAGAADATAFVSLGHVFASVITGNVVLMGASVVSGDGSSVMFGGCALGAYAIGVLLAAPRTPRGEDGPIWPAAASAALAAELALLIVFSIGWEVAPARPDRVAKLLLLVAVAAAMGVQSTAVRRLGRISTTYLTGTFTGLLEAARGRRWSGEHGRGLAIIVTAAVGAAAAALLIAHARGWLPALVLVPVGTVIVGSRALIAADDEL